MTWVTSAPAGGIFSRRCTFAKTSAMTRLLRRLTPFQAEPAVQSLNEQIRALLQLQRAGGA